VRPNATTLAQAATTLYIPMKTISLKTMHYNAVCQLQDLASRERDDLIKLAEDWNPCEDLQYVMDKLWALQKRERKIYDRMERKGYR
jgi:hypothetical protein